MTQAPVIHLNGTSGTVLLTEYGAAIQALDTAITLLGQVTVHGRDYYTLGHDATMRALGEHQARLEDLYVMRAALQEIYDNIHDQVMTRSGRLSIPATPATEH